MNKSYNKQQSKLIFNSKIWRSIDFQFLAGISFCPGLIYLVPRAKPFIDMYKSVKTSLNA